MNELETSSKYRIFLVHGSSFCKVHFSTCAVRLLTKGNNHKTQYPNIHLVFLRK